MTVGKRCHRGRETLLGPELEYESIETHENYGGINQEIITGQL